MTNINNLAWMKDDTELTESLKKLQLSKKLKPTEYSKLLGCAILLIREYLRDNRKTSFFSFGYSIVLDYSLKTQDYLPLYDVATNIGFYPITKFILDRGFQSDTKLGSHFLLSQLGRFEHNGIIEPTSRNNLEKRSLRREFLIAVMSRLRPLGKAL